jgi:serine/threonine-protein kinase RsbW
VSEACTNVINHAADDDEYEVAVHIEDHECVVSVKNSGSGFDADSLTGVMPSPDSARGRGVAIMNAVTDTVDLTSSPQAGTVVRLVKTLTYRSDSPLARLQHRRQR